VRLLIAVAAVAVLAGCGGDTEAAEPAASPEDAYIAELLDELPAYDVESSEAAWLERGWDACKALAEDGLPEGVLVAQWASLQGIDQAAAAVGVAAAQAHLC
jgi:hypothetical protein